MAQLKPHWTEDSIDDFVYRVAADFIVQLDKKIEERKISQEKLATLFRVSPGRVSQVLNNPGNLTLKNTVRCARALGMKVAVVLYEDGDPENEKGPVNSEIFYTCWKNAGSPSDFFALSATTSVVQIGGRGASLPMDGWSFSTAKLSNGPDWKNLATYFTQSDSSTLQ
jgi:transcriptional regulator with XRE-family HTH domain